jgi:Leucine-rich repeat (LRR) protein
LKSTSFGGDLPPLPSGLIEFDSSFTLISGGLVNGNLQNLQNLEYFDVTGCAFNELVPTIFSSLPNLEYLYLSDSFVSGDLSYMEGMPSIIEHWVDLNPNFGGSIPSFIGDLSTLGALSVSKSGMTGTLPTELGKLFSMKNFWLYDNELTGTIPTEYGEGMPRIRTFRVESNDLVGTMPASICSKRTNTFPGGLLKLLGGDYGLAVSDSLALLCVCVCACV